MAYTLLTAVWEITMNCNMRCKHCGSACEGPLPGELTHKEALDLCDTLGRLGLKKITLSGGEPFTRPDWHLIASRLVQNKITTNVISNGWLITGDIIDKAIEAGLNNIGTSIDGLEATHDYIRKKGSFARIMQALDLMKERKMSSGVVTCISKKNIDELPAIKEIIIEKGVRDWQLQSAVPMGNLLNYTDWILEPPAVDRIIDFAYDTMKEGRIRVHLANDVGYFNLKEVEVRKASFKNQYNLGIWNGCPAGKENIGIRCNGDIIGCLSIRDDRFIEGNIRETPLEEIWTGKGAFRWNREMDKKKLTGFCRICQYGEYCRAGCCGSRMVLFNTLGENRFCSYYVAVEEKKAEISRVNDFKQLKAAGKESAENEEFQLAEIYISRALEMEPGNVELLNLQGFIHFNLGNYPECKTFAGKALEIDPHNPYALKGLGICLAKTGRTDEGIKMLKEAVKRSDEDFMDPYHDLAVVLWENDRQEEAVKILEEGRNKSARFREETTDLYRRFKSNT